MNPDHDPLAEEVEVEIGLRQNPPGPLGSYVRLTHLATGVVIVADSEDSASANLDRALPLLRERLGRS